MNRLTFRVILFHLGWMITSIADGVILKYVLHIPFDMTTLIVISIGGMLFWAIETK